MRKEKGKEDRRVKKMRRKTLRRKRRTRSEVANQGDEKI